MGSYEVKNILVVDNVETWVEGVQCLKAIFTRALPQTVYASLTMLIQQEWKFVRRITPGLGRFFVTLESSLRGKFQLDLIRNRREESMMTLVSQRIALTQVLCA